jgi:hypothetical protein
VGFQTADLIDFGRTLHGMPGVSGVWFLSPGEDAPSASLWVLVQGFDDAGFAHRLAVADAIEEFMQSHGVSDSEYGLAYYVVIDDDEVGSPQIPVGAEAIAA